ncbi:MAG: hypothetical protein WAL76_08845, partial [Candidatus Sulfotelmatobacter sp.]
PQKGDELYSRVNDTRMNFINCYEDANRSEPYPWVNETKIAPWVIYVLRRATSGDRSRSILDDLVT